MARIDLRQSEGKKDQRCQSLRRFGKVELLDVMAGRNTLRLHHITRRSFVDSAKIRLLLAEWFGPRAGVAPKSVDEDYADAAQAIKALKSLFQSELERRERGDTHKTS